VIVPYDTERPNKTLPYSTAALIAVNLAVYIYQYFFANPVRIINTYGFTPADPTWYGALTSEFVHSGFSHLAGNMMFLWVFGRDVEDALGHYFFVLLYLVGGLGADVMHATVVSAADPAAAQVSLVGASGAISAIMGLYAVRFYRTNVLVWYVWGLWFFYWRTGTFKVKAGWFIGLWFVWQALAGFVTAAMKIPSGVAYWGHVGGTFVGLLAAILIGSPKEAKVEYQVEDAKSAEASGAGGASGSAIYQWGRVLNTDPTNIEAHLKIGEAYARGGQVENAANHLTIAFSLLAERGNREKAAAAYAEVLAVGQRVVLPPDILFRLACDCEETGRVAEAEKAWMSLADNYPTVPDGGTALIRLANLREHNLAIPQGAAEAYARYLKAYPNGEWRDLALAGLLRVGKKETAT